MIKLIYKAIAFCLILTLVISSGCAITPGETIEEPTPAPPFTTYTDEINGYSIKYPAGWLQMPEQLSESALICFSSREGHPGGNATVMVTRILLPSNMTVSTFYQKLVQDIYSQPGYSLYSKQEQLINNMPVIKLLYSFESEELSYRGTRLLLVQDDYGWIITCTANTELFSALEPTFNEIHESFYVKEKATVATKPAIKYFKASKENIDEGESTILSWEVSNASLINILPMVSSVGLTGSIQLSPAESTTYTLIAYNDSGTSSDTVDVTVESPDRTIVDYDPVTGRNSSIGFTLEQLCFASDYQVQIAKDPGFTLMVFDSGVFTPDSPTSPALLYGPGGVLEAGHTYYWRARVRGAVTGQQIRSPWSPPQEFTVSSGNPVTTPYYGVQLLSPRNNCFDCSVESETFSWTPFQNTTKYRFTLAKTADMSDILVTVELPGTSYEYYGKLEYGTNYYWQVMALEPAPSDPSTVFSFTTEVQETQVPAVSTTTTQHDTSSEVPVWVWVLIILGVILITVVVILIFKVWRTESPGG